MRYELSTIKVPQGCHLFSVSLNNHVLVGLNHVSKEDREVLLDIYRVGNQYKLYIHINGLKNKPQAIIEHHNINDLEADIEFLRNFVFAIYKEGDLLDVETKLNIFIRVIDRVEAILNA